MIDIADNVEAGRFEIKVDGELAGFADYRLRAEKMVFTHTEIRDEFEGQGLGGKLAGAALDAARDTGLKVVPRCSFIAGYIKRHPEYADLIDESYTTPDETV
jgi:uncharacterized protein